MLSPKLKQSTVVIALMMSSFTAGMAMQPLIASAENGFGFGVLLKAYDILKSEYLGDLDNDKLVQGAIRGMMEATGDPYTRYMDPKSYKGMREEREGSFSGIGIQIGMRKHKLDGREIDVLTVIAPMEDTPAWKAGIKAGDIILQVDDKVTEDISIDEATTYIKGKKGTAVKLKVYRENTKKIMDISVVRDNIVAKIVKHKMLENKIGFVRLTTFMSNDAVREMKDAIKKLKESGMQALVFDLRNNPGGLLPNAVNISSMFVPNGPIVQIVSKSGEKEYLNATGDLLIPMDMPMALLVDGGSASASEIVSGALKDNKRAVLIGTKTFGKGLVQTVHELDDGGGMAITTNKYLTTKGTDINKKGIDPDIMVTIPKEKFELLLDPEKADKNDPQLLKAVEILKEKMAEKTTKKDKVG